MLKVQELFLDEIVFKGCGLLTNYYALHRCLPVEHRGNRHLLIRVAWRVNLQSVAKLAGDSRKIEPDEGQNKHLKIIQKYFEMINHRDPKCSQNLKPENIVKRANCHGTLTVVDMSISGKNQIESNQTDKKTRISTQLKESKRISFQLMKFSKS